MLNFTIFIEHFARNRLDFVHKCFALLSIRPTDVVKVSRLGSINK